MKTNLLPLWRLSVKNHKLEAQNVNITFFSGMDQILGLQEIFCILFIFFGGLWPTYYSICRTYFYHAYNLFISKSASNTSGFATQMLNSVWQICKHKKSLIISMLHSSRYNISIQQTDKCTVEHLSYIVRFHFYRLCR